MKWIKTEFRKPEFDKPCLVWCQLYGRFIATYEDIGAGHKWGNWRDFNGNLGILPPIYWTYLLDEPNENNIEKQD
jgi:hypothetical protein